MRTPEHAPHIPHIRLPDIKGAARWVQTNWKPVGLSLAATALGLTGYFMATHGEGQNPPIKPTTGVSDTIKPPESEFVVVPTVPTEAPPTATASPPPEPPKPTATSVPEVKSLPDVINNKTAKFISLPATEIQKMIDESIQQGDPKIPLPDEVVKKNLEVKTIKNGKVNLTAIYAQPGQTIDMPALAGGKVITAEGSILSGGATYNIIEIQSQNGLTISYAYPSGTKWNFKVGESVEFKQVLFSTTYVPESRGQQQFESNPIRKNALITINLGIGETPMGKGIQSILIDNSGNVVTVASSS